jgi:hypothetical protein
MNERQIDDLLNYLSRIASAVETLAMAARPEFRPDHSRAIKTNREHKTTEREDLPGGKKSEA